MSETKEKKFSPGPWRIENGPSALRPSRIITNWNADLIDEVVAETVKVIHADESANARLIAAAPDLLTALTRIRDARDANAEGNPPDIGNYTCFDDWAADVASAAVNLATESRP